MKDVSLSALSSPFTTTFGGDSLLASLVPQGGVGLDSGTNDAFNKMLAREDKPKLATREERNAARDAKNPPEAREREAKPERKALKKEDAPASSDAPEEVEETAQPRKLKPSTENVQTGLEAFLLFNASPLQAYQQLVGGDALKTDVQAGLSDAQQAIQDILSKLAEMSQGQGNLIGAEQPLEVIQGRISDLQVALKAIQAALAGAGGGEIDPEQLKALNDKLKDLAQAKGGDFTAKLLEMSRFVGKLSAFEVAYASVSISQISVQAVAGENDNTPQASGAEALLAQKTQTADALSDASVKNASAEVLAQQRGAAEANVADAVQAQAKDDAVNNRFAVAAAATNASLLQQQGSGANADSGGQELPTFTAGSAAPVTASGARIAEPNAFAKMLEQTQQAAKSTPAEQVTAQVKTAMRGGTNHIHIQLNPVELGSVEIRLDVKGAGKTQMSIIADNPKTLEMLRSDVRVLEQMLIDVGLKPDAGSLSFNLRGDGQQQAGGGNNGQQGRQGAYPKVPDAVEELLAATAAQTYTLVDADGLDIRI